MKINATTFIINGKKIFIFIIVGNILYTVHKVNQMYSQPTLLLSTEHSKIVCGDLLTRYATIPTGLLNKIHFYGCTETENQQMGFVKAIYSVDAADAVVVEEYFTDTYKLPTMKWDERCHDGTCLLSNSVFGVGFEPHNINRLYAIDNNLSLSFKMSGHYDYTKVTATKMNNKNHIKQFTIEISIDQNP